MKFYLSRWYLAQWFRRSKSVDPTSRTSFRKVRLTPEELEERAVPAVITVTSIADNLTPTDGQVTLREAIAAHNNGGTGGNTDFNGNVSGPFGNDTIVFASGIAGRLIALTANDADTSFGPTALVISNASGSLTIDGGTRGMTLDGNNSHRLFGIKTGVSLEIDNLTLQGGLARGGNGGNVGAGGAGDGGGGAAGVGGAVFNFGGTFIGKNDTFVADTAQGGTGGAGNPSGAFTAGGGGGVGGSGGDGSNAGNAAGGGGGVGGAGQPASGSTGGAGGANEFGATAAAGAPGTAGGGGGGASGNFTAGGDGIAVSTAGFGGGGGGANESAAAGSGGFGSGGGGGGFNVNGGAGGFGGGGGGGNNNGGFGGFGGGNGASSLGGGGGGGAGLGGALFNNGGTVTITNSTFTGDVAIAGAGGGGGALNGSARGGAIFSRNGSLTLLSDTISGDTGDAGRGVYVLGDATTATAAITNTILGQADNSISDIVTNTISGGTVTPSGTNNLIRSNSSTVSSQSSADPLLGALANNGGPTKTMALLAGSPAIGAGITSNTATFDQRGIPRPINRPSDVGAYQASSPITDPVVINHGSVAQLSLSSVDPNPQTPPTYSATLHDPLFDVQQQFGLTLPAGFLNFRGQSEWYLKSTNGSNPSVEGYYVLLPNGKLYALDTRDTEKLNLNFTLAGTPVATLPVSVYLNPALLTTNTGVPIVTSGTSLLYDLKMKYGLDFSASSFNARGDNEWYLQSSFNGKDADQPNEQVERVSKSRGDDTNDSNEQSEAAGGQQGEATPNLFVLTPDDKLYAWNGVSIATSPLVADLTSLGTQTTTTVGALTAAATSMTVQSNAGFPTTPFVIQIDAEQIRVTNASTNTWTIVRGVNGTTAANHLASATVTSNVYLNPSLLTASALPTAVGVTATVSQSNGGNLTLTPAPGFDRSIQVTVTAQESFRQLSQTFTFTVNDVPPTFSPRVIAPITAAHGSGSTTFNLGASAGESGDSTPLTYSMKVSNPLYNIQQPFGLTVSAGYFNLRHQGEWYLQSTNGSNASVQGYYVLMPNGNLYALDIRDTQQTANLNFTLAQAPVAAPGIAAYNNTGSLTTAGPASTTLVDRGPLYDIQQQLGLTMPAGFFNLRHQGEWYLQSTNGSNPRVQGYYVLMPNGKLYALDLRDTQQTVNLNFTLAGPVVTTLDAAVYNDPSLLTAALPSYIGDPLFALKDQFGLTMPAGFFNFRGQGEWYLQSTNGSNPSVQGYYVLMPNGNIYALDIRDTQQRANLNFTIAGPLVGSVGVAVYNNPALLTASTGQVAAVTATVDSSGQVTLTPNPDFVGTVQVTATVSDGAEKTSTSFLYTVTDNAPTLNPPLGTNVSASHLSGTTTIANLGAADADSGDAPNLQIRASAVSLFDIRAKYGLTSPASSFNMRGQNEWYFQSGNGSNPSGQGLFVLMPDGRLYALDARDARQNANLNFTLAQSPVADLSFFGVYANTSLLTNATIAPNITFTPANGAPGSLTINWNTNFSGKFLANVYVSDGAEEALKTFFVTLI